MKTDRHPLISIGMPIYNEEFFIAQSLDSLLAQDYENFELIISDNASTDGTPAICEYYASQDTRIRYHRNHENIGMVQNFNRTFQLSHGKYFMWAGGHDLWDKHFISTCLGELLDDPKVVLCSGQYRLTNEKGMPIEIMPAMDTRGMKPAERLRCAIRERGHGWTVYSLIRAEVLIQTHLFTEKYGSDSLLAAELSVLGEFCSAPNTGTYMRVMCDRHLTEDEHVIRLVGPSATKMNGRILRRFPWSQLMLRMCGVVCRAYLPFSAKTRLISDVVIQFKWVAIKELSTRFWPRRLRQALRRILSRRLPRAYRAWQRLGDMS